MIVQYFAFIWGHIFLAALGNLYFIKFIVENDFYNRAMFSYIFFDKSFMSDQVQTSAMVSEHVFINGEYVFIAWRNKLYLVKIISTCHDSFHFDD